MARGEESSGTKINDLLISEEMKRLRLLEEQELQQELQEEEKDWDRPRAGPLSKQELLDFARWYIPTSAALRLDMLKIFAEKDPPISTDNEILSNDIQRFKDGQLTLKSLMIHLAQKQFPECLLDFEDYNPDKRYPMPQHSLFFPPSDDEEEDEDPCELFF
ncbi:hypothetical protein QL285_001433 [Trifolium repens]|nr:hypothetical protein QL285_001429 [Trifolium repens]KAK2453797.1 hypothetical protein QL285_001431 [Trifolium repens]KAK2453800.1 hypothetical protein QL285_001433 [Trifolium repens]